MVGRFDPVLRDELGRGLFDPYITFTASPDDTLSLFDPFKFLSKIWPADDFPVPDPTTRDGLRAFFSHIDGDGFASLSNLKRDMTCAAVVRDEILKSYPLPVTVSIVEANTRAVEVGLEVKDKPLYEEQAREIFALPNVQAASHSYSHPYSWIKDDPDSVGLYATENLILHGSENYAAIDYEREIAGSTSYIERELLPDGKKVEIMLWSGNCRPPAEALAIVRRMGIENMNGGDTITTKHHPSLATVAPWYRCRGVTSCRFRAEPERVCLHQRLERPLLRRLPRCHRHLRADWVAAPPETRQHLLPLLQCLAPRCAHRPT